MLSTQFRPSFHTVFKNALIVSALLLALTGCTKLTQENFDKLEMGMSLSEIETHIGTHSDCSSTLGTQSCLWGAETGRYIKVRFVAGAAVTFESEAL